MKKLRILMNFNDYNANVQRKMDNTYGAVGYYRIIKPAMMLDKDKFEVTIWGTEINKAGKTLEERWDYVFKNYDVYWTNYFVDGDVAAAMFTKRDEHKKKIIIDLDDNFWDILPTHPLYDRFRNAKRDKAFLSTTLSFADVITVSTEPLKERCKAHMKGVYGLDSNVQIVPNMNDMADWDFKAVSPSKNKIVIGYAGSNSHQDDLSMIVGPLKKVMEKHKNVHFECIGVLSKDMLPLFKDFSQDCLKRIDAVGGTYTFKEYPVFLSKRKWDITIAPLVDSSFAICKSHIKWMESAMFKIPIVASRVYPYFMEGFEGRETIQDGVTGLLAKPQEWEQKLNLLIEDTKLRKQMGENAYNFVVKEWQYKNSDLSEVLTKMIEKLFTK